MTKRGTLKTWTPRLVWGVVLTGDDGHQALIGRSWSDDYRPLMRSEPSRPLLFESRAIAREWCAAQHEKYRGRTDCCGAWRFRPVRIRESWEIA